MSKEAIHQRIADLEREIAENIRRRDSALTCMEHLEGTGRDDLFDEEQRTWVELLKKFKVMGAELRNLKKQVELE